jgi:DNA-binding CsgD family transcriptional regulator
MNPRPSTAPPPKPHPGLRELAPVCVLDRLQGSAPLPPVPVSPADPMPEVLSDLLWQLYASAASAGIGEFEQGFLATLRRHVPFDAAWTGRSTFVSAWPLLHNSCLDGLPSTFVEDWLAVRYCDPLAHRGNERPDKAMVVTLAEPWVPRKFRRFGDRHGLAHLVNVASREGHDGLLSFLSLYRRSAAQPFTAQEAWLLENVVRHLDLALDFNRSHHLVRRSAGRPAGGAVCDHWGLLHQAGEGFRERLQAEWPDWQGAWLPGVLVEHFHQHPDTPYLGQRLRVDRAEVAGLWQLAVAERLPTDVLSARELDVLRHYGDGLTYKQVARHMDIAPATVRHHLRNLYKKLGVSNKGQLLRVVAPR